MTRATVSVDYSGSGTTFLASTAGPACAALPPGLSAQFADDGAGHLTIALQSTTGFSGPLDLAVCKMAPHTAGLTPAAIAAKLRVTLAAGTDVNGAELTVLPARGDSGAPLAPSSAVSQASAAGDSRSGAGEHHDGQRTASSADTQGESSGDKTALAEDLRRRATSSGNRTEDMLGEREREGRDARERARVESADGQLDEPVEGLPNALDEAELLDAPLDAPLDADPEIEEEDEENDPDVRHNTPAYDCYIDVLSSVGMVGSLRFDVRHTGNTGGWDGADTRVACRWNVGGAQSVCTDSGAGRLRCVVRDAVGFDTPTPIVTCRFKSSQTLVARNFNIEVIEALNPDARPLVVEMAVAAVAAVNGSSRR